MNIRTEILKSLPIPVFYDWWKDNYPGTGFHVWADELLEMQNEGVVKIDRGRVELVKTQEVIITRIYTPLK